MSNNQPSGIPETCFKKVQYITIDDDHMGRRIDNFLFNFLKDIPKGRIYKMLRKGEVRVNKRRVSANARLKSGDQLRIPPVFQEKRKEAAIPEAFQNELIQSILYDNDTCLVIDKPSGIPVHAGSGLRYGVIEGFRKTPMFRDSYIELAHRLDRETSGCLVLVKQAPALRELNRIIKENRMEKRYMALVKGRWSQIIRNNNKAGHKMGWTGKSLVVNAPLQKNTLQGGERIVQVHKNGKEALSEFYPRQEFSNATLVEVKLHTGRTHQIRVHAAYMGMPIACDNKYGNHKFNKEMKNNGCRRLFLHASHVGFQSDSIGKVTVDAPLPEPLKLILGKL